MVDDVITRARQQHGRKRKNLTAGKEKNNDHRGEGGGAEGGGWMQVREEICMHLLFNLVIVRFPRNDAQEDCDY